MRRHDPLTLPSPHSGGRGKLDAFALAITHALHLLAAPYLRAQPMAPAPADIVRADETPAALRGISIDQRLDGQIPLELSFRDEIGRAVRLSNYFGKRPVILALVYYDCPMLCTQVLNGLVSALRVMSLSAGRDFEVVAVSFDAREKPAASRKRENAPRLRVRPSCSTSSRR